MENLLTLAVVVLVTIVAVRWHLRKSTPAKGSGRSDAATGASGGAAAGTGCPRCGAALTPGATYCGGCGVPTQIFEIAGARTVTETTEEGDGGRAHAVVRADVCVGCGTCVPACPEAGALRMEGKLAVVDREKCMGHGDCVEACPVSGIILTTGAAVHRVEVPDIGPRFESNVSGVWIVGELGGRGLIKNAINEGRIAAEAVADEVRRAASHGGGAGREGEAVSARAADSAQAGGEAAAPGATDDPLLDVVIVGSGPAGISAGLESKRQKLSFVIVEQGTIADSIRKYPRHKLLLAEPVRVPLYGELWIADGAKETLLDVWETVLADTGIEVRTGCRVENVVREGIGFRVEGPGFVVRARCVILALGRRGRPRRLGVPGEDGGKVFYDVAEMEEFRGRRVLVVGGGDSALESAVGMGNQPGTEVLLSYRKGTFDRAKSRNVEKLDASERAGRVRVLRESVVTEILPEAVRLDVEGEIQEFRIDDVVVRIGGESPAAFLEKIGIRFVVREIPLAEASEAVNA